MADNNTDVTNGGISLVVGLISGTIAWLNGHTLTEAARGIAAVVSIAASVMACIYYYRLNKKNK